MSNPYRLYRNPDRGLLTGVCAGVADYFGFEPMPVRFAAVLAAIFFFVPVAIAYVVLSFVLRPRPPALFQSSEEEAFWRGVATAPDGTLQSLRRKFGDLEDRLRHMEGQVTSGDYDLHRKFRDLGA